jgi:hypothetical protein
MSMTVATTQKPESNQNTQFAQQCGVINPYALAELINGRKIDWKSVPDKPQLLENILQTPYNELFDPKYGGPLYTGLALNDRNMLVQQRSDLLDITLKVANSDLEDVSGLNLATLKTLGDLGSAFKTEAVNRIAVERASMNNNRYLELTLRLPELSYKERLAQIMSPELVNSIAFDPSIKVISPGWTPPNGSWSDTGRFFNETTEFFDPVQGAVANCYYIAALSAVAWARPYEITHMTRAVGANQQQFTNMVRFYKPDSNKTLDQEIEVTDSVPINAGGNMMYARSSETGEIWPAVYEKAFAKLKTGVKHDHPDITATGWGDCVYATAQLTGEKRYYYGNNSMNAHDIWNTVRANSRGGRTFNPMTAWTYSTQSASDQGISYSNATIVGSHCYTILGWDYRMGKEYVVLRNPWGNTEATVGTIGGSVTMYDISWYRSINLATVDGTFAMEASAFKTYFAGFGTVK